MMYQTNEKVNEYLHVEKNEKLMSQVSMPRS